MEVVVLTIFFFFTINKLSEKNPKEVPTIKSMDI
jgi:hypothetical protein